MLELRSRNYRYSDRKNLFVPIAFLWGLVVAAFFVWQGIESIYESSSGRPYLLPWILLTAVVVLAPSAYLYYKRQFNLFHPLVFAVWTYFFPAFVIGGFILAFGYSYPVYFSFIDDETYNLPLTFGYIILGYAGLTAGFFLPLGKLIGAKIGKWLPVAAWNPGKLLLPGLVLLLIGISNMVLAFSMGLLGFQRVTESGAFDGLVYLMSMFWIEACLLLFLSIFRSDKLSGAHYLALAIMVITFLLKSAFQGNRGSLFQIFILVSCAFVLSRREILFKHKVFGGLFLIGAMIVGMVYGTTFRTLKTSEESVTMGEYADTVLATFSKISEQDLGENLTRGFEALAERVESVSALAVVVSNYEKLAPYEESYGIENNILKDSLNFLIPRFLWDEKFVASDPRKYGDLYFNFDQNSFTITPMGDLLRNFGPVGVPLGMIFLGIVIRIMYASLIEDQAFSFWRSALYYMSLTAISYEGGFGLLIPYNIKVIFIAVFGLLIVWFFMGRFELGPKAKTTVA